MTRSPHSPGLLPDTHTRPHTVAPSPKRRRPHGGLRRHVRRRRSPLRRPSTRAPARPAAPQPPARPAAPLRLGRAHLPHQQPPPLTGPGQLQQRGHQPGGWRRRGRGRRAGAAGQPLRQRGGAGARRVAVGPGRRRAAGAVAGGRAQVHGQGPERRDESLVGGGQPGVAAGGGGGRGSAGVSGCGHGRGGGKGRGGARRGARLRERACSQHGQRDGSAASKRQSVASRRVCVCGAAPAGGGTAAARRAPWRMTAQVSGGGFLGAAQVGTARCSALSLRAAIRQD